jgi:hypothetical protein
MDFEQKRIMPPCRALHVAIGTVAQFELLWRQTDVIGEWAPDDANRKLPAKHLDFEHR